MIIYHENNDENLMGNEMHSDDILLEHDIDI